MAAKADVLGPKRQRAGQRRVIGNIADALRQFRQIKLRANDAAARAHRATNRADRLLDHDVDVARADHVRGLQMADKDRRADGRMPRERQLAFGREDARARGVHGITRALQEDGLGQVELARDGLHLPVIEIVGVADDRQRIAAEPLLGEHIERVELLAHE